MKKQICQLCGNGIYTAENPLIEQCSDSRCRLERIKLEYGLKCVKQAIVRDVQFQERIGRRAKINDEAWYRKRAIYDMFYDKYKSIPRLREIRYFERTGELARLK